MSDYVNIVQCPVCGNVPNMNEHNSCCGFKFEKLEDILDLRVDKSFDTLLDLDEYDIVHSMDKPITSNLAAAYCKILEECGLKPGGDVLEIASGSGNLTASLLKIKRFDTIHSGDISFGFMTKLSKRVENVETTTTIYKYLFDANRLPFADRSFDFVFGNSVLHHFAHFENTIRDAFRVLKPGGAAVFAEPIIDCTAYAALAAGLIARGEVERPTLGMTPRHIAALNSLRKRVVRKMINLRSDRGSLRDIEDKFEFPISYLRELAAEIGFSRIIVSRNPSSFQLGEAVKLEIKRVFRQLELAPEPLDAFQPMFDAFTEDYGAPLGDSIPPMFARIVFIRA